LNLQDLAETRHQMVKQGGRAGTRKMREPGVLPGRSRDLGGPIKPAGGQVLAY